MLLLSILKPPPVPKAMKLIAPLLIAASAYAALVTGKYCERSTHGFALCPKDTPLTCSTTEFDNSCCFESPGGVILQTQFWDYDPATGPSDSFTLHGLWPDNCDGTYAQYCNDLLNVVAENIETIIGSDFHDKPLLKKMQTFWKNYEGADELLWEHEFNKHGTCINTNSPDCYGSKYKDYENAYNYYKVAFNLFEKYPTYKFLTEAGIVPSAEETYTFEQISKALSSNFDGHTVYFSCDDDNALNEVWYFHHMQGPLIAGNFVKMDSLTESGCSSSGIKFMPKSQ